MANRFWLDEEQKFLQAIQDVAIPNAVLSNVDFVSSAESADFNEVPAEGGCYWIWTTEPVYHSLHKRQTPTPFDGGEIIYNGIAKDNVRGRVQHHLLGEVDAGWSGISMDVYFGNTTSHRKKALSEIGKVPYVPHEFVLSRKSKRGNKGDIIQKLLPVRTAEDFHKLHLSPTEIASLEGADYQKIYFRNGINIHDEKHAEFEFRAYYITGLSSLYLDFIEKKWREDNNWLPRLCSYSSGR